MTGHREALKLVLGACRQRSALDRGLGGCKGLERHPCSGLGVSPAHVKAAALHAGLEPSVREQLGPGTGRELTIQLGSARCHLSCRVHVEVGGEHRRPPLQRARVSSCLPTTLPWGCGTAQASPEEAEGAGERVSTDTWGSAPSPSGPEAEHPRAPLGAAHVQRMVFTFLKEQRENMECRPCLSYNF